jgi:plastocyanin
VSLGYAVVTLYADQPDKNPAKLTAHDHFIDQRDETFLPLVEIVPVGDTIIFRNSDRTRHHVYSFSPLKSFEFVLKPNEQSAAVPVPKPGIIAVGCNIHDFMINYLYVTDARWFGKSDEQGNAQFADVPAGTYNAHIWHPRLKPGAPEIDQKITIGGDAVTMKQVLPVLPERRPDNDQNRY